MQAFLISYFAFPVSKMDREWDSSAAWKTGENAWSDEAQGRDSCQLAWFYPSTVWEKYHYQVPTLEVIEALKPKIGDAGLVTIVPRTSTAWPPQPYAASMATDAAAIVLSQKENRSSSNLTPIRVFALDSFLTFIFQFNIMISHHLNLVLSCCFQWHSSFGFRISYQCLTPFTETSTDLGFYEGASKSSWKHVLL